jgi:predicted ribosome quality control (RQC) complex YloA/Tae2 family protein
MAQAADPEVLRAQANLLLARLGEVARGAERVTLKGFSGEDVTLELDPSLSPHENAQALYEEAARRERAVKRLPTLLEKAREKVADLEALEGAWAEGMLSAEEVFKRLPSSKAQPRWKASDASPRLPFRRFRSSGGLEIRVGRGSKDNDALTFKHSHPDDIWLHAREAGGAHVVLRWREEGSPPARDLDEAAALAALNSKARGSQTVPVDWTRRKYVRKPRKAPPGTVTLERAKTVFVEPNPELPDRLAWET